MKRRQLVAAGLAAPWTAVAQPAPVIGFLCSGSPAQCTALLAAFREGLGAAGYVEGRNLSIEFAWALGQDRRLPALAASLVRRGVALLAGSDAFFYERREQLAAGVVRHRLPACFDLREFAVAGALMSYGANLAAVYRVAGSYTGRILGGARPSKLPVQKTIRLELVLNLKAAGALGLAIAQPLRLRADEVIE